MFVSSQFFILFANSHDCFSFLFSLLSRSIVCGFELACIAQHRRCWVASHFVEIKLFNLCAERRSSRDQIVWLKICFSYTFECRLDGWFVAVEFGCRKDKLFSKRPKQNEWINLSIVFFSRLQMFIRNWTRNQIEYLAVNYVSEMATFGRWNWPIRRRYVFYTKQVSIKVDLTQWCDNPTWRRDSRRAKYSH